MSATHWYKIHLYRATFHQVTRLVISELDGRSLHNRSTDSGSDGGRLLGSMPATQRYKVDPPATLIPEVTVLNEVLAIPGLDGGFLPNRRADSGCDCRRLLGPTPATQRYKVRLYRIETEEIAVFCGGGIRSQAGDILLDGGLLHNRWTDLDPVCGRLLGSMPAIQRYKVRLCRMGTQEFAVFCGGGIR